MTNGNTHHPLPGRRLVPFLIGTALGNAGDLFTQVAVFWTGLSITGTALSVAGLGGVWTLCAAVAGLVSGPIIDRFNRRTLLITFHSLLALLCFALVALAQTERLLLWHLVAFLAAEAIFGTPVTAAFTALLPDIVPAGRLVRVNGLLSSWGMADNLVEAALSGLVLALWGPAPVFLFNGIMYLVGGAAAAFVPYRVGTPPRRAAASRWRPLADLAYALRFIARERLLRRIIPLDFFSDVLFAPLFFIAPLIAAALGWGSEGYGYFQSLTLGGVLAGSLIASSIGANWPKVPMWIGGMVLFSVAFLALGVWMVPTVALGVFFLFGLGVSGGRVYGHTLVQQVLPSGLRGRVNGIRSFLGGVLQPLSLAVAMARIDDVGVRPVLIGLSLLMLAVAAGYTVWVPLRERDWTLSDPSTDA